MTSAHPETSSPAAAPVANLGAARPAHAFPPVLNVEVTNDCNLECPMCARTTSMTRPVQHMTEAVFRRVVDEAAVHGVSKLWLHMFGESLLHPQVYDFIAYAASKERIRKVEMSTNVTTLTPANARRLLESGLDHLILSVDAYTKESYAVVRGFDFERVLRNARTFLDLHREMQSPMSVNVSIILMGIKEDEVEGFTREWDRYKSDQVKVFTKRLVNFGGQVDIAQFLGKTPRAESDGRRKSCAKLWDSLTVMSNGEIVACCYDVNGTMPYGNIQDTSLQTVWDGDKVQALRDQHLRLDFSNLPLCMGCDATVRKPKTS